MESKLLAALSAGHLIVTAHRRQARQIRFRYATLQKQEGVSTWETPRVASWDDWMALLSDEITWSGYFGPRTQRKILSRFQEWVLWERVIGASGDLQLHDLSGAARQAQQAWALLQAYRLPDPASANFRSVDSDAFGRWMRAYHRRCNDAKLIDQARLPDSTVPALRAGAVNVPAHVLLVGFFHYTPQQRTLLKTLEDLGTQLDQLGMQSANANANASYVRLPDSDAEYRAAARWVRVLLSNENVGQTAVLIPDLVADRRKVERIFDDILMPGSSLPNSSFAGRPYNTAVGPSFDRYPIVASALNVCALLADSVNFNVLSSFLRTPYTRAATAEQSLRARFDAWLRENNVSRADVVALAGLFERFKRDETGDEDAAVFDTLLHGMVPIIGRARADLQPSQWAALFTEILDVCGWPGDLQLHSGEFQTVQRLRALLDEFAGLDFLAPPLAAVDAVALLRRLAVDVTFQPQTPELSVQLLLPEQAYGMRFDNLWICGWHAEAWPLNASPNPFIPIDWQRKHAIPGASAAGELVAAKKITSSLLCGAGKVIASVPRTVQGRPVAVSPLLQMLPQIAERELELADVTDYQAVIRAGTRIEHVSDETGPELEGFERVQGGSRIFALQAQCPFRAFAELRLGATELEQPIPGLDARTRGQLVHWGLEHLWLRIGSSDVLEELLGGEYLQVQVWEIVDRVLTLADRKRLIALPARYREIEHQRLVRLIVAWLQVEAARPAFEVASTEVERSVQIGRLDVKTKVDRIDRLAGGGVAIIDYKMGEHRVSEWFGVRPDEPQLPLYAVSEGSDVVAVLFGRVSPNKHALVGVCRDDDVIPDIKAFADTTAAKQSQLDWNGLFDSWRTALTALADEYADGVARVDPKPGACRYCHLGPLCRVGEHVAAYAKESADA